MKRKMFYQSQFERPDNFYSSVEEILEKYKDDREKLKKIIVIEYSVNIVNITDIKKTGATYIFYPLWGTVEIIRATRRII